MTIAFVYPYWLESLQLSFLPDILFFSCLFLLSYVVVPHLHVLFVMVSWSFYKHQTFDRIYIWISTIPPRPLFDTSLKATRLDPLLDILNGHTLCFRFQSSCIVLLLPAGITVYAIIDFIVCNLICIGSINFSQAYSSIIFTGHYKAWSTRSLQWTMFFTSACEKGPLAYNPALYTCLNRSKPTLCG